MKITSMEQIVAVLAVSWASVAAADEATFMKLDRNADGFISAEESIVNKRLYEGWSAADANNDGRIDTGEFSAFELDSEHEGIEESAP